MFIKHCKRRQRTLTHCNCGTHLHECFEIAVVQNLSDCVVAICRRNLEQTYELLQTTFDPSVLGPRMIEFTKRSYLPVPMIRKQSQAQQSLAGAEFRVSGQHEYDVRWESPDAVPDSILQVTESVVCVTNGALRCLGLCD